MATAAAQRRWRARDTKSTIELRLSAEAVARLDWLIERFNARGRAEVIERLLLADPGEHASLMLNEALRLGRAYLLSTGHKEGALRDATGETYVVARAK
jgi:urease accessory protein UreH